MATPNYSASDLRYFSSDGLRGWLEDAQRTSEKWKTWEFIVAAEIASRRYHPQSNQIITSNGVELNPFICFNCFGRIPTTSSHCDPTTNSYSCKEIKDPWVEAARTPK